MFKQSYKSLNSLIPKELDRLPKDVKAEIAESIFDALEAVLNNKSELDSEFARKLQEIRVLKRLTKESA